MSEELIERLRAAVAANAREVATEGPVTCERALRDPPGKNWCRARHGGHICRYSDPPRTPGDTRHSTVPHACRCGEEWG